MTIFIINISIKNNKWLTYDVYHCDNYYQINASSYFLLDGKSENDERIITGFHRPDVYSKVDTAQVEGHRIHLRKQTLKDKIIRHETGCADCITGHFPSYLPLQWTPHVIVTWCLSVTSPLCITWQSHETIILSATLLGMFSRARLLPKLIPKKTDQGINYKYIGQKFLTIPMVYLLTWNSS